MNNIGFLGFGEVGSTFAQGLKAGGAQVKAYDKFWNIEPEAHRIQKRAREKEIELLPDPKKLADWADIIISVTTPKAALDTAEMILPDLRPDQIYADLNSATPSIKQKIEILLKTAQVEMVDGGILSPPSQTGIKTQIVIAGNKAALLAETLNKFGMNFKVISDKIGQASAFKVIRSIFTKGIEAILLECLVAAEFFEIRGQILDTLVKFLSQPSEKLINMLITTNAVHSRRRSGEMEGVLDLLTEVKIDSLMTEATMKKLLWSADLGLNDIFDGEIPNTMEEVIQTMIRQLN